jgi:hypothetical protein
MSIKGSSKSGPYDKFFDPTPYSKGAAMPKGTESINYDKGKIFMRNGNVLLHSQTRDSMVRAGQEQGRFGSSDLANVSARESTQAAYVEAYGKMSKNGITTQERRKLDSLERDGSIAGMRAEVDSARRAIGTFTAQAASDSKLEPAEQEKIKHLQQKMGMLEKTLEKMEDQDFRADREDRQLDRADQQSAEPR